MKLPMNQKGMTAISMLIIGLLVAIVAISAFKIYPSYYDDFAVSTALKNMEEEGSKIAAMKSSEIRKTLQKRIQTSGVKLAKDDVVITKDKGAVTISVNYEVRTPMYGNIDAVTKFSHSITVTK
ncbi:MAG: hypothetical protein CSA49_05580 [Gammaproteobacteria bacterium]|nr:MAG: hypothetical protein CSA49_05580 [Gammaproteobacteria bacterium]